MELPNEIELNRINKTIKECTPKAGYLKEKYIIQQKILNHLISVYQTKAKFHSQIQSPHSTMNKIKHNLIMNYKSPLPSIKQYDHFTPVTIEKEKEKSSSTNKDDLILQSPKSNAKDNRKEKLKYLKAILTLKSQQKAKEQKDKMKILNDNLRIYKDNIILENINKRNVILTRKKILEDSIDNYKTLKKKYIELMNSNDIDKLSKVNKQKQNELLFWKEQTQNRFRKSNSVTSMSSDLFLTQKQSQSLSQRQSPSQRQKQRKIKGKVI